MTTIPLEVKIDIPNYQLLPNPAGENGKQVVVANDAYALQPIQSGSGPSVPTPTPADDGKFLSVAGGVYALAAAPSGGGSFGQYVEGVVNSGAAVPLVSATAKTVVSILLPAGDWDVSGVVYYTTAGNTSTTAIASAISIVNNTFPSAPDSSVNQYNGAAVINQFFRWPTGSKRLFLAAPTTVYLIASANFTVNTTSAYGVIRARRFA